MVLKYFEYGDTSNPLMVMVHGWPDDPSIWTPQVQHFKEEYHVVCVNLPCYSDGDTTSRPSFAELLDSFAETVEQLRAPQEKIVLVAHDWGTTLAYLYERRYGASRVHRLVTMDIGPNPKPPLFQGMLVVLYQLPLVFAFLVATWVPLVGRLIGSLVTTAVARLLGAPGSSQKYYSGAQNYLYYNFWRTMLLGAPKADRELASLPRRYPEVPTLFLYSTTSPVQFHTKKFRDFLEHRQGSRCIGYKCSHWIQLHSRTNDDISSFLES